MITLKENEHYKLVDVRNTKYKGCYQILEPFDDNWRTCGEYNSKLAATWYFNRLSEGKGVTLP